MVSICLNIGTHYIWVHLQKLICTSIPLYEYQVEYIDFVQRAARILVQGSATCCTRHLIKSDLQYSRLSDIDAHWSYSFFPNGWRSMVIFGVKVSAWRHDGVALGRPPLSALRHVDHICRHPHVPKNCGYHLRILQLVLSVYLFIYWVFFSYVIPYVISFVCIFMV